MSSISALNSLKRKNAESSSDSQPSKPGKLPAIGRTAHGRLNISGLVPSVTTSVVRSHLNSSAVTGSVMASAIRSLPSGSSATAPLDICPKTPQKPRPVVFTGVMYFPNPLHHGFDLEKRRLDNPQIFRDADDDHKNNIYREESPCHRVSPPLSLVKVGLTRKRIPTFRSKLPRSLDLVSPDLSLMSILTFMYTKAYQKHRDEFPDGFEFRDTLPPYDLAIETLNGMSREQIQLMSLGCPWRTADYFSTLQHIEAGRGQVGLYHVEVHHELTAESVQDYTKCYPLRVQPVPRPMTSAKIIIPYGGSSWRLNNAQLCGRGLEHFTEYSYTQHPTKPLYKSMYSENTVLKQVAVDVKFPPSFLVNYGHSPILLMEQCFAFLKGTFIPKNNLFYTFRRNGGNPHIFYDDSWDFLPPALVTAFAEHASIPTDENLRPHDIMNQAIGWGGSNVSFPILEDEDLLPPLVTRCSQPTPVLIRREHDDEKNFQFSVTRDYWFNITREQTTEMRSRGFVIKTKDSPSTKAKLQVILMDEDDDEHWANLPEGVDRPQLFEDARRIVIQLTWIHPENGTNESINLRRMGLGGKMTPVARARYAMTWLEYSTGVLTAGQDTGPERADFFQHVSKKDVSSGEGTKCPECGKLFHSAGPPQQHFKSDDPRFAKCRRRFNTLSKDEQDALFHFFECKNCHKKYNQLAKVARHLGDGVEHPDCFAAYNGQDPTEEDSAIYIH
ncbi:hypothetical protein KCU65_g7380, partial [Aureobasidium melanogenum]